MSNSRLLLLVSPPKEGDFHNDNHEQLTRAFAGLDWQIVTEPHDFVLDNNLTEFDLIWPVGFGPREGYNARVAALSQIPADRIVTPATNQRDLHSKSAWLTHAPESHRGNSVEDFANLVTQGSTWVLKPNAGSFGRAVQLITNPDDLPSYLSSSDDWLLQRYVPEIVHGEHRTLIAGTRVIGTYKRLPRGGFKANLSHQGEASASPLPKLDKNIVESTHQRLIDEHIGFAAIDTCAGFVMEVNVANPGGIGTLEKLYGGHPATNVVQAVLSILKQRA